MSLAIGDVVHKLDKDGNPMNPSLEAHVKFEVVETGSLYDGQPDSASQLVKLKLLE